MKYLNIEKMIKNIWIKVEDVDKKAFWIFFISLNIVYLYNSIHCLFGNEDVYSMFQHVDIALCNFMGRYSSTWLEYFFSNKTIIPMFANLICFFFLSLSTIMTLNWFQLKKTLFNYLLAGLFILLVPFLQAYMWYRSVAFGILMMPFFIIVSFFICQKIDKCTHLLNKILYLFFSIILLTVFAFGTNTPVVGTVCGVLITKIFIDFIDSGLSNIKYILFKYRFFYLLILGAILIHFVVLKLLVVFGILNSDFYNIKLIEVSEIGKYLLPFLLNTVNYFFFFTFPYVGVSFKVLLFLISIVSFSSLCIYFRTLENSWKKYMIKVFIITLIYILLFYLFNIVYFLSPELCKFKRFFRLEYYTTAYFVFVCIVIGLKYANNWIKNIFFVLLFVVIFASIQINMHIQKDQYIGQQVELFRVMTLKNLILGNKNYEYSDEIKYDYVQIGEITYSVIEEIYNANKFSAEFNDNSLSGFHNPESSKRDLPIELFSTFQGGEYSYIQSIVDMPPRILNINPYSSKLVLKSDELINSIDEDVKNWLLNEARPYPSKNCVFINKGKIFVVMNLKLLESIKWEFQR